MSRNADETNCHNEWSVLSGRNADIKPLRHKGLLDSPVSTEDQRSRHKNLEDHDQSIWHRDSLKVMEYRNYAQRRIIDVYD